MFIGYQNDKIAFIAETREELENIPCVVLDKIEETDKEYFLHNGEYVCEIPFDQQVEEMRQARADAYASEVDPLMAEYNRKKTFNLFEEGEEEALLAEIETKVEEIKSRYPYPESDQATDQPTDQVDDKFSPVDTVNDTVSDNVSELEK